MLALILMVFGWIDLAIVAFGNGLGIHVGHLSEADTAIAIILIALCIGPVWVFAGPRIGRAPAA